MQSVTAMATGVGGTMPGTDPLREALRSIRRKGCTTRRGQMG